MNQQPLPGASTVLTMGILSIVGTLFCCGPFGAIFSIIGLVKAKTANQLYQQNPENYTDYSNVKTGKILSYIGLALSIISLVFVILYFGFIVAAITTGELSGEF
ncbi:CCC motif membrane protein [Flagellimonas halotolerans]|uniref:CCC motif membrane protein n=1 Tax=Flagellimonas halotolerans TaxID=3112164 RepID=A0ABU6IPU5_9FLAO|nr:MULTISPECIES: CCC motif membrane protein [unclassified Allomuricauda]MEC3965015.1 CCC motif membrane protein [Muricauda sp. SYSU M86414]MEC4265140.1 CCC motif membrane protein [Muricauda sp. SYSU M84420]